MLRPILFTDFRFIFFTRVIYIDQGEILIHLVNLIFCEMNIIVDANGDCDLIQQLFVTSSVVLRKTKVGEDTLYSETSDSKLQMLKVKNCHPLYY